MAGSGRTLKGYEAKNLIVFLGVLLALGGIGAFVFRGYRDKDKPPEALFDPNGILNEFVSSSADACYYYIGTQLTGAAHTYKNRKDIPATDDGLIRGLFDIPGVVEVFIDQKLIVLTKDPKGHWEAIQPAARELIKAHLHMHK